MRLPSGARGFESLRLRTRKRDAKRHPVFVYIGDSNAEGGSEATGSRGSGGAPAPKVGLKSGYAAGGNPSVCK